ncbi:hypothetical protein DL96DRAFT_1621002 [Flagelloscypha sp. PMI_526]|nr:hypothetical protein DL96DRAFT_1621002 [Flagelloscypha sp. PMI_526]
MLTFAHHALIVANPRLLYAASPAHPRPPCADCCQSQRYVCRFSASHSPPCADCRQSQDDVRRVSASHPPTMRWL